MLRRGCPEISTAKCLIAVTLLGSSAVILGAGQDPMIQRAGTINGAVAEKMGSAEGIQQNGLQPIMTSTEMSSVDGSARFATDMACDANQNFMTLGLVPGGAGDIQDITINGDLDIDGSMETTQIYTGPYAGVCANGMIQCDAGTTNHCRYLAWTNTGGTSFALTQVTAQDLGGCYCVNNACGSNLLIGNSSRIMTDIGYAIISAIEIGASRLVVSQSKQLDVFTTRFMGSRSGCGKDVSASEYADNPLALTSDGLAATQTSENYALIMSSPASAQAGLQTIECQVKRDVVCTAYTRDDIMSLLSATRGALSGCGQDCFQLDVGSASDNIYNPSTPCEIFTESLELNIAQPERIDTAKLLETHTDDYLQLILNGQVVWAYPAAWTDATAAPPDCSHPGSQQFTPNTDLTGPFKAVSGDASVILRIAVKENEGEGYAKIGFQLTTGCAVDHDEIINGCEAAEANSACSLYSETIDGVSTISQGLSTGLAPLPSTQQVGQLNCDSGPIEETRDWWLKVRAYQCETPEQEYDLSFASQREAAISGSLDPDRGTYTDYVLDEATGTYRTPNGAVPEMPDELADTCISTCRVKFLAPGTTVSSDGDFTSALSTTGEAWQYSYRYCDAGNCPAGDGETVDSACDCTSNFTTALSSLQALRMLSEDFTCGTSSSTTDAAGDSEN